MALAAGAILVGTFTIAPAIGIRVHVPKREFLKDLEAGRIVQTAWSTVSRIDFARKRDMYMIWFDGGSQHSRMMPPDHALTASQLDGFQKSSTTLAYRLKQRKNVLVLASSGGNQVRGARHFGAEHVTGVEIDPSVCRLLKTTYDEWLDGLFTGPDVELVNSEGRSFLRHSRQKYDVIQIESAYSDAMLFTGAAGAYNTFLLTTEAIKEYWNHLTDDGVLWLGQAQSVKLFTQVLDALEELGVDPNGRIYYELGHLSLGGYVLLLRKTPFPEAELDVLEQHVRQSDVTVHFAPDGLWQRIGKQWRGDKPDPGLRTLVSQIEELHGAERTAFLKALPYDALPSSDDKPFYNRYFDFLQPIPSAVEAEQYPREIKRMANAARKLGPVPISDVPPLVILLEAALLMLPVIVLPWVTFRRRRREAGKERPRGLLLECLYFVCIGLGFIAVEVVLARRFVLFFGSPTVALAVVLGGLLTFAGIGSTWLAPRVSKSGLGAAGLIAALAALLVLYAFGLDSVFAQLRGTSPMLRYAAGLLVLMPLGLIMGVPFPNGLRQVSGGGEGRVAWAWALNGYASVVATASIGIGIQVFGYRMLFFVAAAMYALAALCSVGLARVVAPGRPA
jgi:spermidine synthase